MTFTLALSFVAVNATSFLLSAVVFLAALLLAGTPKRTKNLPPGPDGLPLLGVTPFLGKRPDMKMMEYSQKYGDVMAVRVGTQYVLVLSGIEVINEALSKQGDVYSARPWSYLHDVIWCKDGISMTNYSEAWKEQRKFVLTSLRKFGFGKASLEGPIADEARYLSEALRKCGDYKESKTKLMDALANVICKLCLGTRFDYDADACFMLFAHNVTRRFQDASWSLQASILMPWSHCFPPFRGPLRAMKKLFSQMHKTMQDYIEDHKNTINPREPRDFVDDYLIEIKSLEGRGMGLFSERMLKFILRDLFLGGLETLFSTMTWSLLILANRPELQEKIQAEIDSVIGREGRPTIKHKEQMHLTLAFMTELMRYRTLLPFGVARMTTEDTTLKGYDIPKGTTVLINIYGVHNDPNTWGDPLEFKIERHLTPDGKFEKHPNVIQFGAGYRYCLGKQLAEMEYFLFLTTILQNFNVRSGTGGFQHEDLLECGFVCTPPPSTDIHLEERP